MIRRHENPVAIRAGALSLLVHVVLLTLLLVSFNWKSVKPMSVAEVELWDSVPVAKPQPLPPPPAPEPEPPKPEPTMIASKWVMILRRRKRNPRLRRERAAR